MTESRYSKLGVDAQKRNVRKIFGKKVHNEYPGAFVNIATDPDLPEQRFTLHIDGDGSKIVQRLLHFAVTRDIRVIRGAVDDAFQMNYGDIASAGFVDGLLVLGDVIDIFNMPMLVPKELILEQVADRIIELIRLHETYGYDKQYFMGGETADLRDQVRSMVFNVATFARTHKKNIIRGNTQDGDAIYGFASYGQAIWENEYIVGLGSNGYTQARPDLMHPDYCYFYPHLHGQNRYCGKYYVTDTPAILEGMTVSEALISPTRQYSILIRMIIDALQKKGIFDQLHGIVMNTGGGATKIGHIGTGGIVYEKSMPNPPPIFHLIQREPEETSWKDMFETFNCGIGIDVIGEETSEFTETLCEVSKASRIKLYLLGTCRTNDGPENKVVLNTNYGSFEY